MKRFVKRARKRCGNREDSRVIIKAAEVMLVVTQLFLSRHGMVTFHRRRSPLTYEGNTRRGRGAVYATHSLPLTDIHTQSQRGHTHTISTRTHTHTQYKILWLDSLPRHAY